MWARAVLKTTHTFTTSIQLLLHSDPSPCTWQVHLHLNSTLVNRLPFERLPIGTADPALRNMADLCRSKLQAQV